jgi:hypothetical protein
VDRTIPQWTKHMEAQAGLPRLARLFRGLLASLAFLSQQADSGADVSNLVRRFPALLAIAVRTLGLPEAALMLCLP